MTGTLNRSVPATDLSYKDIVHTFRKRITFQDTTAVTVGVLPPGAVIVGGGVQVITAFNDASTDLVDVGTSADPDAFATDLDVSSVGFKALDELATADDYSDTAEVTIVATYAGATPDATAGVADVIINFVLKN